MAEEMGSGPSRPDRTEAAPRRYRSASGCRNDRDGSLSVARTVQEQYLAAEVLCADPVKLVWLLYCGGIDAVRDARRHLAEGGIVERSRQINKAWGILQELSRSLDREQGGEISRRLAGLYAYMQTRLIEGNTRQSDAPLQEVETLLLTLSEAWYSVAHPGESGHPAALLG
jgi:flagellar secretion chaperone FliS